MKRIISICAAYFFFIFLSSCDDNLKDELFTKYTYLLDSGWVDSYSLVVNDANAATLPLKVGVSGTSLNSKKVNVKIEVDPVILLEYNEERFKGITSRYFKELPQDCYTFDNENQTYIIESGSESVSGEVNIDLNKLEAINIFDEYVLPLRITESVGELRGPEKYITTLAKVNFKNVLSGDFAGNGTIKYKRNNRDYTETVNGRSLHAIGKWKSYLYLADNTRQSANASKYILTIVMESGNNLILSANNDELELVPLLCQISRTYREKSNDSRYYIETTVLDLKYTYKDPYDGEDEEITYSFEASLSKVEEVLRVDYPDVEVIED